MKCDLCQRKYRDKANVLNFRRQSRPVLVEDVSALICDLCGDTLLSGTSFLEVKKLLDQEPQGTEPLYRYPEKVSPAS